MIDLYRRNLWNDGKCANVVASACFHKNPKVMATALKFLLGVETDDEEDEEDIDSDAGGEVSKIKKISSLKKSVIDL